MQMQLKKDEEFGEEASKKLLHNSAEHVEEIRKEYDKEQERVFVRRFNKK